MTGRLAELEGRIGSVEKLGAVVGAMRGSATARVQEARDHAAAIRAYAGTIGEAIAEALAMFPVPEADRAPGQDKRGAVILIAAEQGFVGTYNEQVFAAADPLLSGGNDLLLVGHRGAILAAEAHRHVRWSGEMIVHPAQAVALVTRMTDALFAMLAEASVAEVRVVHAARPLREPEPVRPRRPRDRPALSPRTPGSPRGGRAPARASAASVGRPAAGESGPAGLIGRPAATGVCERPAAARTAARTTTGCSSGPAPAAGTLRIDLDMDVPAGDPARQDIEPSAAAGALFLGLRPFPEAGFAEGDLGQRLDHPVDRAVRQAAGQGGQCGVRIDPDRHRVAAQEVAPGHGKATDRPVGLQVDQPLGGVAGQVEGVGLVDPMRRGQIGERAPGQPLAHPLDILRRVEAGLGQIRAQDQDLAHRVRPSGSRS